MENLRCLYWDGENKPRSFDSEIEILFSSGDDDQRVFLSKINEKYCIGNVQYCWITPDDIWENVVVYAEFWRLWESLPKYSEMRKWLFENGFRIDDEGNLCK